MLTAKGYELSQQELREQLGILTIIAKPFSPRELLHQVDQVCKAGATAEQFVSSERYLL